MAGFFIARLPTNAAAEDSIGRTKVPLVAAAASWLETFKLPLRHIERLYRKSELAILAWRSSEISANMASNYEQGPDKRAKGALWANNNELSGGHDDIISVLERRLGPVAAKLDERLALNELTGPEVVHYMNALGIPLISGKMTAPRTNDPVVEAYRGIR